VLFGSTATTYNGLPSLTACAVFFLALCTSLHMVPLEMLIFWPASSWDIPSKSTILNASTSANSMYMGSIHLGGFGAKIVVGGTFPIVMGLGNLPLLPYLCLPLHIIFTFFSLFSVTFIVLFFLLLI